MDIYVCGLGAIGSNLLVQLAKQYPDVKFHGIDDDKVEERNILTQAYFKEHVGVHKTLAIQAILARKTSGVKYVPYNVHIGPGFILNTDKETSLIIDCFDNSESRQLLIGRAKNVLHIGFSPHFTAEMIWDPDYDVPNNVREEDGDICTFGEASSFINFVVNFAALNIDEYIKTKVKNNYLITNKWRIKKL